MVYGIWDNWVVIYFSRNRSHILPTRHLSQGVLRSHGVLYETLESWCPVQDVGVRASLLQWQVKGQRVVKSSFVLIFFLLKRFYKSFLLFILSLKTNIWKHFPPFHLYPVSLTRSCLLISQDRRGAVSHLVCEVAAPPGGDVWRLSQPWRCCCTYPCV